MSTVTIKIKRRASSGLSGGARLAQERRAGIQRNTSDKKLYYGYGDDGSGNATSIIAIAGENIPNSGLANSSVTINGNSLALGGSLTLDTDDIGEGSSNLYFTNARLVDPFLSPMQVATDRLHTTAALVLSRTPGLLQQRQERISRRLVESSTTARPASSARFHCKQRAC